MSLISQLENIKVDENEAKELSEKHQLDSLNQNQDENGKNQEEDEDEDKMAKMDAFQANLDKIKNQNAQLLEDKKPKANKSKGNKKSKDQDSSDSDD